MKFVSGILLLFSSFLLSTPSAKSEGGCPDSTYPVGGGYCRNIICNTTYTTRYAFNTPFTVYLGTNDPSAVQTLAKYNKSCKEGTTEWGTTYIPKR